jgi:ABC-2 type transport system permease protein
MTEPASERGNAPADTLRCAVAADLLRARSGWRLPGLLFVAVFLDSLSIVGTASTQLDKLHAGTLDPAELTNSLLRLGFGGLLFATIFGVLLCTAEFRCGSIARSARAAGGPGRLLLVKVAVALAAGTLFGLLASGGALLTTGIVLTSRHAPFVVNGETWYSAIGVLAVSTLGCSWGALLGWLGRAQVATLLAVIAWTLLAEPTVLAAVPSVGRFLPGGAQTSIYRDFSNPHTLATHWGYLLFCGWLALAAGAATVSNRKRDLL